MKKIFFTVLTVFIIMISSVGSNASSMYYNRFYDKITPNNIVYRTLNLESVREKESKITITKIPDTEIVFDFWIIKTIREILKCFK